MTIEKALELLENDYLEGDIKALGHKDRLNFYVSLKEFFRAKLQRAMFEPIGKDDVEIKIRYENN